ncbi:MAG: hypothetical protein JW860_01340 [Sedimentisphaerales bacterium]|nr:hypothetical protein [Sedimentisphaerales bacterium]
MSTVVILTPIIISSWPVIAPAIMGAAAALGLVVKDDIAEEQNEEQVHETVEVELAESEVIAQNLATEQELVLAKGNLEIRIKRDERGRCVVCASGRDYSKAELEQKAQEFTQKMTQCFVYNRVVSELQNNNMQIVNEEVMEDDTVRINVRHWVD